MGPGQGRGPWGREFQAGVGGRTGEAPQRGWWRQSSEKRCEHDEVGVGSHQYTGHGSGEAGSRGGRVAHGPSSCKEGGGGGPPDGDRGWGHVRTSGGGEDGSLGAGLPGSVWTPLAPDVQLPAVNIHGGLP